MSNNNKTPAIRFKGFTDTWEQREVGELCSISTGKSNTQDKIDDGIYPFYVRSPIVENSNKYLYDEEAVITVGDGVGTGKVFHYVNGKYDLHQRCYRMYGFSEELDAKYFYHTFSLLFYKRVMAMTAKTSVDSVRLEMISDMEIPTPSIDEQLKIGQLFTNLDTLITLHQRKCDKLIQFKAAMLKKMFPQNGADKPEIRFKGFTDAWEQRKCSDFIKLVGGATPSKANKDYWDGDIVWLSSQEIKGGFVSKGTYNITQKAVDDNTTKMIPANTPMFISRSGILANSFPITRALCDVAINQDIKALLFDHTVFSNDYIVHYLESKEQFILKSIVKSGTTVQSVSIPDFEKMPINIPASKDEQDRIGIYFENLDTLITLHQRKCDKYKSIKSGLIRKLFP